MIIAAGTISFSLGGEEKTFKLRSGIYKDGVGGLIYEIRKNDVVYRDMNGV